MAVDARVVTTASSLSTSADFSAPRAEPFPFPAHTRSHGEPTPDAKIWRGLWYCMFMCDKAPVQRELAENLAGLLSLFRDDRPEGVRFFRSFCVTMQR